MINYVRYDMDVHHPYYRVVMIKQSKQSCDQSSLKDFNCNFDIWIVFVSIFELKPTVSTWISTG